MADDGSQQRKPDCRTAVEDVKALATVVVMKLESVLGRRLQLRSPAVLAAIGVVATLALALVVVMVLLQAGDANAVSDNAALIAALVALGGVFTAQMVGIALDDRRTKEARNIERQSAQDDASQAYLDQMSLLLLDKDRPLRQSREGDELRTLARARTLTVLSRLDGADKGNVVQFLNESHLITKGRFIVDLYQSDLSEADLSGVILNEANLRKANLGEADLSGANLIGAILREANLIGANLREANLIEADLREANLSYAKGVTNEQLSEAESLKGATMPDGQTLRGDKTPNGPTFGEWLKDRERRGKAGENE